MKLKNDIKFITNYIFMQSKQYHNLTKMLDSMSKKSKKYCSKHFFQFVYCQQFVVFTSIFSFS